MDNTRETPAFLRLIEEVTSPEDKLRALILFIQTTFVTSETRSTESC